MTHCLKILPQFFEVVNKGKKNFELRKNDRPFEVGDTLILQEYRASKSKYTGKEIKRVITYVLKSVEGMKPDYCILGISQ